MKGRALMSYHQVALVLGISPGRVRKLELRALEKLRRAFRKRGIRSV